MFQTVQRIIDFGDEMLENLDKVNWSGLGNPNIPRWLEGLASVDESIRHRAIYRLSVDVVMEDRVYDGNLNPVIPLSSDVFVAVVPFLLELLEYNSILCKSSILSLINSVAWFHIRFKGDAGKLGLTDEHLERALSAFTLICGGKQILLELLIDPETAVTKQAKQLLDVLEMSCPKE